MMHTFEYEVTSEGRVYSLNSNWRGYGKRELVQNIQQGYLYVRLILNGKRVKSYIHQLVAKFYLPEKPSDKHEVRHLDGNSLNNASVNLAWGTCKENAADRELHGKTSNGLQHSIAIKNGLIKKGYYVKP